MHAIKVFLKLEKEDFDVLKTVEETMEKYKYAPKDVIVKSAALNKKEVTYRLRRLSKFRLIHQIGSPYRGYAMNNSGYDCLAIGYFVDTDVLQAFGKPVGVGKEADVYDAKSPKEERIAVKFHRLGRTSFRQTIKRRGYTTEHVDWFSQSKIAADKEFQGLKLVFSHGVSVPKPISKNRHALVMGMIQGTELARYKVIPKPTVVLTEILKNVQRAYLKANVIHADLSEYNVILKNDMHVQIIDWPQYITSQHPNAKELLTRDIDIILTFFKRRMFLKTRLEEALEYVTGNGKTSLMI
ncbi:MAG: RIO1 family regulatory kinase/ATPase [Candidatus Bathyarchaeota archaeon]|jgi:RIO kinase 2